MYLREVVLLIGVALTVTRANAQLPELPQPRPVPGQPLPQLPPPRRLPPLPPLARQALESNGYRPVCEPEIPTYGLWGVPTPSPRSWQECWMNVRDCLAWICTRPTCAQGMRPPSNASLFDWLCDCLVYRTSRTADYALPGSIHVTPPPN